MPDPYDQELYCPTKGKSYKIFKNMRHMVEALAKKVSQSPHRSQ